MKKRKTKKVPISLNAEDQELLDELIHLIGQDDQYGNIPKAIKFGINLAVSSIRNPECVYCSLNPINMHLYLSSVKDYKLAKRKQEVIENLQKE
jgi:hypothetical protein